MGNGSRLDTQRTHALYLLLFGHLVDIGGVHGREQDPYCYFFRAHVTHIIIAFQPVAENTARCTRNSRPTVEVRVVHKAETLRSDFFLKLLRDRPRRSSNNDQTTVRLFVDQHC